MSGELTQLAAAAPAAAGLAVFDTALGPCGVVWSAAGIVGVQFPEATLDRIRARLGSRFPGTPEAEPPPAVAAAIEGVRSLLAGDATDLRSVELDLAAIPDFDRRVYEVTRAIPPGATRTYGEVAASMGAPGEAREVGRALGDNPIPIIVPCHRVTAAGGKLGGFSARGGVATKRRLLGVESGALHDPGTLFDPSL